MHVWEGVSLLARCAGCRGARGHAGAPRRTEEHRGRVRHGAQQAAQPQPSARPGGSWGEGCASRQVPDPKLKYQQLLVYGKRLPPMKAEDRTEDNKVRGCVSQVGRRLAGPRPGL